MSSWSLRVSLLVVLGCGLCGTALAASPAKIAGGGRCAVVTPPLHTDGAKIRDAHDCHVQLRSVNWFGAESGEFVVGGLDQQPLAKIVGLIVRGGFNSVRLPWSNELLEHDPPVDPALLAANPQLRGKSSMQVFDAVVQALTARGIMVILDNHRSRGDWCCDSSHGDGLWHTEAYPESAWLADWKTMVRRYRDVPLVVAAELRNEIRSDDALALKPSWGDGVAATDWQAAATRGGDAVLSVDPDLLVIVGGINYQANLAGVRDHPVVLSVPQRVVYAAHDYAWWQEPAMLADPKAFAAEAEQRWGYVREPGHTYTAPVYISEWGGCLHPADSSGKRCTQDRYDFVSAFARYACDSGIDWAYWPLNGSQSAGYNRTRGTIESYGLLKPDWSDYVDPGFVAALRQCSGDLRPAAATAPALH